MSAENVMEAFPEERTEEVPSERTHGKAWPHESTENTQRNNTRKKHLRKIHHKQPLRNGAQKSANERAYG